MQQIAQIIPYMNIKNYQSKTLLYYDFQGHFQGETEPQLAKTSSF